MLSGIGIITMSKTEQTAHIAADTTTHKTGLMAKLGAHADRLQSWHHKMAFFHVIGRLPSSRAFVVMALLVGLLAAFANFEVRQSQYQTWQNNKQVTFLGDTPLFSTTDASFFLALARTYNETGDARDFFAKRSYPNNKAIKDEIAPQDSLFDFPLFSVLIAKLSPDNSTTSLLTTGNGLIPILGFVTALGILLAFGAAGYWLEGSVAAIGAGLAPTFLVRSAIGRIDTDILNLGFFYAVLGLTIFAARAASWRAAIIWVIAAAIMMNLFFWWYSKAEFGWAFTVGLIWLSAVTSRTWQRPVVLGLIFIFLSGLVFQTVSLSSESSYLKGAVSTGNLIFPSTFTTITELRVVPFDQILTSITESYGLGLAGVLGLVLFAVRHPVLAVVYGPASIFALANFLVGNRTIFYSAPMIWFGVAFLAVMIVRLGWHYAPAIIARYRDGEIAVAAAVIAIIMGGIYSTERVQNYAPNPTFSKEVMRGFAAAENNLPQGSVVATWWDYGYASALFNGYRTFHDGGTQNTPMTHYIARALLAKSQDETYAILQNLADSGMQGISDNSDSFAELEAHILGEVADQTPPIFLVLTEQMGGWMGSISKLGMWDTKNGAPINVKNSPYGPTLIYNELKCQKGQRAEAPICNGMAFDLGLGTIDNNPVLNQVTQAQDGSINMRNPLQDNAYNVVHIANLTDKGTRILLMHQRLAQTSFHQLFHLGEANADLFRLVYDDYPYVRIYALR